MARPGNRPEEHTPHEPPEAGTCLVGALCKRDRLFCRDRAARGVPERDAGRLAKIIQDIGYRAEIAKNNAGKRFVRTRIGGKDVAILLFLCSDGEVCKSSTIAPISRRRRRTMRRRACASPTSS